MSKDKFRILCEQVLVPRLGNLMHSQLLELHATLDIIAAELLRLEHKIDAVSKSLEETAEPGAIGRPPGL